MATLSAFMVVLATGQFNTPASPAIPSTIEIVGVSKCSMDYKGATSAGEWVAAGRSMTVAADSTSFTTDAWGFQYIYFRLTGEYPDFARGRRYKVSFTMDISDSKGNTRDLAFAPQLLRYKKGQEAYYSRAYVWPVNFTAETPHVIYGGVNLEFSSAAGSNRYEVEWLSPAAFADASGSLWIYVQLASRPESDPVTYRLGDVCIEKHAESVDPPPALASYSERVTLLVPPHPGNDVMTKQADCPWDEAGLLSWENEVGKSSGSVTLPAGKKILLSKASLSTDARFDKIEVPATSTLVFADEEISFSVKAFVVAGELLIGSPTCRVEGPIRITFFGSKSDGDTPLNGHGTKGFAGLPGSKVDIFGRRFYPTWSRLARIVRADDDRAYLQEAVNWYPGQEILLTTTIHDDTDIGQPNQNEVRIIKAVSADGKVVQFTEPVRYTHYAGTEYQGEVALLSRHVMLEGEPDADGFGGHFIVAGSNSRARIAGVATRYMGQTNVMARYPLHMHLMENQPESYFSDNTMRDTYFRCVVIHGTHGILNTENVAFNATGNCFYVEDGVEENNTISYNLAAYVKPIGTPAAGGSQDGAKFYEADSPRGLGSDDTVQPADHTAAGFYFSNSYNRIIGNVASGGWSGFGFPGLPKPIGVYASKTDLEPQSRPLLEFRGNVVHSSGWYWGSGGCIYIGGQLTTQSNGKLFYNSGRFARHTRVEKEPGYESWEGTPVVQVFENTLLYGCNKGVLHWGHRVEIVTAEIHDVSRAGTLFGEVWLTDAIINGASGNVDADFITKHHDGFQFYDISVKSVVTNIEFRNYQQSACRGVAIPGNTDWVYDDERCGVNGTTYTMNNIIWSGLYHSDEFKPQQISAVKNIKVDSGRYGLHGNPCSTSAIAGGVNTAQHTSRMHQGGDPACTSCGNGSVEDEAHIFWRCGAYIPIRAKAEYAAIVAAEKRDWPRCLLEHGVATTRTRDLVGPVQSLMAEILAERARHVNQEWKDRKARTPWELCGQNPVRRYDFPYQRIAPAWAWLRYWDERTFLALVDWLAGLEWSSTGDVASVELAVDFELYSGLDVRLPKKEAKTLREKANGMRCMISAVMKLAAQQELGGCLPGSIKAVTTALSFIGLPSLPGLEPRPRHRMPATGGIVQEQLKGNGAYDNGPVYNDERRARAGRWPAPQRPAANPDPVHFLGAVVDKRNATKCVAHYKGKCEVCRRLGDKQGPTVQACCRHHHAADDGLPIAICDRHRMSRCAVCNTPKTCCAAGHHGCREHNRGPCEGCRQLPTLAERRPAACCGKGHHSADEPKATKPAAPPNTNTPAPAATPRSPAAEQLSESPRKGRKRILQETPRPTTHRGPKRPAKKAATRQRTRTARYTNVDKDSVISFKLAETGASRMFNFIDFDGSATLEGRPTIVGSNLNWWQVGDDCRLSDDWHVWLCPKAPPGIPEREVAHIKVLTPDITYPNGGIGDPGACRDYTDTDWTPCNVGYVALWGHGPQYGDEKRSTIITANAGITGITGTGWWLWLDGGAPKKMQVKPSQVPEGSMVRLAVNYPSGTKFTVKGSYAHWNGYDITMTLAASLDDVWANPREQYFFDGTTLYLAPTMPVALTNGRYERGGAWIYDVTDAFTVEVVADCAADSKGFCTAKPQENVPAWSDAYTAPASDRPTAGPQDSTPSPPLASDGAGVGGWLFGVCIAVGAAVLISA
ncbi:Protein rliB [Diplonema papillatum]|nr:Protein rliB [Diplonema papillatum]